MITTTWRFFALSALLCISTGTFAQFDANEQSMIDWIDQHSEDAILLLEKTVNINSGTLNTEGVRQVGGILRSELEELGLDTEWIEMPADMKRAGHLVGRKDGEIGRAHV